ncbi:hypothetical protein [Serinicoccus kebangsaanensis]|uniref:hypothetical protein n=1 Tax=Serinicoccus kebangsaanensis TaxID=2602069 RepID=UPI00124CB4E0|nr:hypothetical protein [Serinicoccus kebangsaanensis]
MTTRTIWLVTALLAVGGIALLYVAEDGATWLRILATVLVVVPVGLATNISARRRRAARRADAPDSVESRATHAARSDAFEGSLILVALTILALTVVPGALPMVWAVLCLLGMVALFWVRYTIHLERLGG